MAIGVVGTAMPNHKWQIIFFGSKTGDVTLDNPTAYTKVWNDNNLEIDN